MINPLYVLDAVSVLPSRAFLLSSMAVVVVVDAIRLCLDLAKTNQEKRLTMSASRAGSRRPNFRLGHGGEVLTLVGFRGTTTFATAARTISRRHAVLLLKRAREYISTRCLRTG